MLKRIIRSLVAFAAIVVAYQAYVLLAVPWMEPPIVPRQQAPIPPPDIPGGNTSGTRYQRLLANYFPPDHWSQQRPPKVIAGSNQQAMLVLDDYKRHDDGRVDIARFALLMFPTPLRDDVDAPRDAVVLEAPQGAKLQFDEFRPERGVIGRITRGEFPGRITIRSDMREPGPDDDLLIETADLSMNTKLLYSTNPVRFRMGRNVGGGNELEIRFLDDEHGVPSDSGLKIAGIDALEIRRDVRARLFLESDSLLPGEEKDKKKKEPSPSPSLQGRGTKNDDSPVEVSCSGPFHFDFVRYVAGFDRDVEMRQIRADGPSDQLSAQQVDVHFAPRQEEGVAPETVVVDPSKRQQRDIGRLEPVAVVAQGHPVVVSSPMRNAEARGGRVQLGLRDRRVVVSGGSDVRLVYGSNVLQAPAIEYQHPAPEAGTRIGRFRATGPGTLDYVFDPKKPEQVFRATWQTSVGLGRYQGQPLLTLVGRPQMGVAKMGALEADQIQVFVRETDGSAGSGGVPLPGDIGGDGKLQIVPDRLAAIGGVEVESRELTGNTEELLVAFRVEPPAVGAPGAAGSPAPGVNGNGEANGRLAAVRPAEQPQQAYHINTDRLRIEVAVRGERMAPTNLSCDGNVLFREIPLVATAEKPLEVRGGQLTVDNLDSDMRVTVAGSPPGGASESQEAVVAARGMNVLARTVQLDQRENRMWIDGPGKATMLMAGKGMGSLFGPAAANKANTPQPKPNAASVDPVDITWQGGLNFDGEFIVIRHNVAVQGADEWIHCHELAARLTKKVEFGKHTDQQSVDLAEIECRGQVVLDYRSRDELGLSSHERMKLERLSINQQTGAISGDGPGELRSTHFSDQMSMLAGPANGGKPNAVAPPPGVRGGKLHFLRVDFQRALAGNLIHRELRFVERVRTVYGPVDSWEQELDGSRRDQLPPDTMTLACDDLAINEDPQAVRAAVNPNEPDKRKIGPVQLRATGNVRIDGQSEAEGRFGASAESASYEQSKDVFVLEGSEGTPATLWRRQGADDNSPPLHAQRINYDRSTGQVSGRFKYLEYVPPEAPQNARGAALPTR